MIYIVYYLLILLFVVLGDKQKGRSIVFRIMACMLFIAIVGFRKYTVGVDSESYRNLYYAIPQQNYVWIEIGFDWLIRFLDNCHCEYNGLYLACITLTAIPIFIVLEKCEHYTFTAFMLYTMTLTTVMNGIRQCIAVGLFMLACLFIIQRKKIHFFSCMCIALLFHYSCVILFPLYFLLNKNLNNRTYTIIYVISFVFCFINPASYIAPLVNLMTFMGHDYTEHATEAEASLSSVGFIFNTFVNILIFYLAIRSKAFEKFPVIANCVFIALVLKNVSFNMPIVGRMMMYFSWFQFLLIPLAINHMKITSQDKLNYKLVILILFYIGIFHNLYSPIMKMMPYDWCTRIFV